MFILLKKITIKCYREILAESNPFYKGILVPQKKKDKSAVSKNAM